MAAVTRNDVRGGAGVPVVVCVAGTPEERARLAASFGDVAILVLASDADSAREFLGNLHHTDRDDAVAGDTSPGIIHAGGLRIDLAHHESSWLGRPLTLTQYELKVLACLASQPGRVWTHRQLHDHAWDGQYFTGPAALQSVVKRLRAKLRQKGASPHIRAIRGVGFRLDVGNELTLVRPSD